MHRTVKSAPIISTDRCVRTGVRGVLAALRDVRYNNSRGAMSSRRRNVGPQIYIRPMYDNTSVEHDKTQDGMFGLHDLLSVYAITCNSMMS